MTTTVENRWKPGGNYVKNRKMSLQFEEDFSGILYSCSDNYGTDNWVYVHCKVALLCVYATYNWLVGFFAMFYISDICRLSSIKICLLTIMWYLFCEENSVHD